MAFHFAKKDFREKIAWAWTAMGLYLFLSAFFWASGPAPLRSVYYLFLVAPLLLVLPWQKFRLQTYGGYYTVAALTFAGYSVLSTFWGESGDFGFYAKQWLMLAFWLGGVAWLFQHRNINISRLNLMIIIVGAISAIATLFLFYVLKQNPLSSRLEGMGLAENPTIVAQIFGVAVLLAFIESLRAQKWNLSLLYFTAAIVCALPIIFSQSRGAALALITVCFIGMLLIKPRASIWVPQVLVVLVALIAVVVVIDFEGLLENRGLSFRDIIWSELLSRSLEQPFFGLGLEHNARIVIPEAGVFHHAHNTWLDIFYYTGLLGVLLSVWHLILLLRSFTMDKNIFPVYLWLVFGCICLFTNGSSLLTRPDAQWWMYWIPAGLLAALSMSRRQCPNP